MMARKKPTKERAPLHLVTKEEPAPLDVGIFRNMRPAQQVAWDRMWDMLISGAMPHVLTYLQEEQQRA